MRARGLAALSFAALMLMAPHAWAAESYGLSMYGDLKYPAGFTHFDYTNPDAPKGGTLRLSALGGFDSLNPFIIKGDPAPGLNLNMMGQGLIFESLMTQSSDEPFSMYGLLAQSVDLAPDRSSVTFILNPAAKFSDGTPVTADDVAWTFNTLLQVGSPFFKAYYADVSAVKTDGVRKVTFTLKNPDNRELPLVLAQMVVLPRHDWTGEGRSLSNGTLRAPIGSGAYKIGQIRAGAQIEFVRDPNWWGKDLPVNRGRYNFDRITYDMYRDANVAIESFFAGNYDVREENVAKLWATGYTAPAVKDGRITKAEIPHAQPVGMQGFIFNIRRDKFSDPKVRAALNYAFDYEWANKQLADGAYARTNSYFENSELGATGAPSPDELAVLKPFADKIPAEVVTTPYKAPTTDGSGNNRANLKKAGDMLDAAGWKISGPDKMRHNAKGEKLAFECLEANPAMERWLNPFVQNLKKIGVTANIRVIDPAQYQNRMNDFDFDMTTMVIPQSDSPGNEQRDFWQSAKADIKGSRNYIGIKNPVVDSLVDQIIAAPTRADLVTRTRALDRILLWNHYLVPGWHYAKWRVAWWKGLGHPDIANTKSIGIVDTWWSIPAGRPSP
jgi:microcin C transport system substrate-binding protein